MPATIRPFSLAFFLALAPLAGADADPVFDLLHESDQDEIGGEEVFVASSESYADLLYGVIGSGAFGGLFGSTRTSRSRLPGKAGEFIVSTDPGARNEYSW